MTFITYAGSGWQTFTSILLFIIALSVLVAIHELGHLIAAKSFKVYCDEFSIGMGPKLFRLRPKNTETFFAVRLLPLGGFVSMYGESEDNNLNGLNIPKQRSVFGVNRFKRLIIFAAGIVMNFILAYIIFFVCAACFEQQTFYSNKAILRINNETTESVIFDNRFYFQTIDNNDLLTWVDEEKEYTLEEIRTNISENELKFNEIRPLSKYEVTKITNKENGEEKAYLPIINLDSFNYKNLNYNDYLYLIEVKPISEINGQQVIIDERRVTTENGQTEYRYQVIKESSEGEIFYTPVINEENQFNVTYYREDYSETPVKIEYYTENEDGNVNTVLTKGEIVRDLETKKLNIELFAHKYWNGWNSFKAAGIEWVDSTTAISKALGNLFIGVGYENLGGPVAIFSQTTNILTNYPFYYYLRTWGVISVNLALFNLLPFPGLDGWQILVLIVEGSVNLFKRRIFIKKNNISKEEIKNKKKEYKENTKKIVEENISSNLAILEAERSSKQQKSENKEEKPIIIEKNENNEQIVIGKEEVSTKDVDYIGFEEWQINSKVKNIVSYVGLFILFGLMAVIFILDIVRLF